jgi:hypothetical protein
MYGNAGSGLQIMLQAILKDVIKISVSSSASFIIPVTFTV